MLLSSVVSAISIVVNYIIKILNFRKKIKKENKDKIQSIKNSMMDIKLKLKKELKNKKVNEENWDEICKSLSDVRILINELNSKEINKFNDGIYRELLPIMNEIIISKSEEYYVNKDKNFKIKLMAFSHYMLNYGSLGCKTSGTNVFFELIFFGSKETKINPQIKKVVLENKVDLDNNFPSYYEDKYLDFHNENRFDWKDYFYRKSN